VSPSECRPLGASTATDCPLGHKRGRRMFRVSNDVHTQGQCGSATSGRGFQGGSTSSNLTPSYGERLQIRPHLRSRRAGKRIEGTPTWAARFRTSRLPAMWPPLRTVGPICPFVASGGSISIAKPGCGRRRVYPSVERAKPHRTIRLCADAPESGPAVSASRQSPSRARIM
jgi:hypothetical protein